MSGSTSRMIRSALLLMLAGACSLSLAAQPSSKAEKPGAIDLPAGRLIDALDRLENQSGVQIMFETALVRDIRV